MFHLKQLIPIFNEQEITWLETLLAVLQIKRVVKGQMLYQEGQAFNEVYITLSGLYRSFYLFDAQEINLRFLAGHSLLCPFSAIAQRLYAKQDSPYIAAESIECVSAGEVLVMPLTSFLPQPSHPNYLIHIKAFNYTALEHYLSLERRLKMIQHKRAKDRYDYFCQVMPAEIVSAMPNYHVASYLGITPEVLSRIKNKVP
jgi:CRP-like cAMP-binding protein